jgi:serine/threonine-protein kinase
MYELGQDDKGHWYFSMKRILGHTLFDIIVSLAKREPTAEKEFDLNRLLSILTQVGDALAYAHASGVIHRDVKPENIIVGRFGEVTLIDWGSAKVWGMPNEVGDDTPEERTGTPLYMSPEQVDGRRMVDERTDVYSLGVVMYEMMAQREPFRGANIRETFANITSKEPIKPSEAAPHRFIPQELERICLKAMARNPSDRFQSMRTMMDVINEYRNNALLRGSL